MSSARLRRVGPRRAARRVPDGARELCARGVDLRGRARVLRVGEESAGTSQSVGRRRVARDDVQVDVVEQVPERDGVAVVGAERGPLRPLHARGEDAQVRRLRVRQVGEGTGVARGRQHDPTRDRARHRDPVEDEIRPPGQDAPRGDDAARHDLAGQAGVLDCRERRRQFRAAPGTSSSARTARSAIGARRGSSLNMRASVSRAGPGARAGYTRRGTGSIASPRPARRSTPPRSPS